MAYLSLYRKYRSQRFEELAGQEHVTRTLQNALRAGRVAHAYLFSGPRGTGKTSAARLLARALNCERGPSPTPCGECVSCREIRDGISPTVVEIDAASSRGIDEVRELRQRAMTVPSQAGARKVFIVDEVHMLTTEACNALLKTLEEPPAHVLFVLATTDAQKLPATILSRCQRFEFRRGSVALISERLRYVAEAEGFAIEPDAVRLVARASGGSWRDAISLLEQVLSFGEDRVTAQTVAAVLGSVEEEDLLVLADGLARAEGQTVYPIVERLISAGTEPRQLARDLGEHFRALLMADAGALPEDAYRPEAAQLLSEQAGQFGTARLVAALEALAQAEKEMRWSDSGRVVLEVALARLMLPSEGAGRHTPAARVPAGASVATTGAAANRVAERPRPAASERPAVNRVAERTGPAVSERPAAAAPAAVERNGDGAALPATPAAAASGGREPAREAASAPAAGAYDPFAQEELPEGVTRDSEGQTAPPEPDRPPAGAPPPSAAAPTPSAQPPTPATSLTEVRDRWNVVIEELKRKRALQAHALLAEAQPLSCDGQRVVIGFRYDSHRDLWERGDNKARLAAALEAVLGQPLQVRSEVMSEAPAAPGPAPVPRQPAPGPADPQPVSASASFTSTDTLQGEALVHEVIAAFDGTIVDSPDS